MKSFRPFWFGVGILIGQLIARITASDPFSAVMLLVALICVVLGARPWRFER